MNILFIKKFVRITAGTALCLIVGGAGCGIIENGNPAAHKGKQEPINLVRKKYKRPPLSRSELDKLISMTIYEGAPEYYGDLILDKECKKNGVNPVVFSHRTHRSRYTCNVCHLELEFSLYKGKTGITREDYLDGRYCGACHNGTIAFSTDGACTSCHIALNKKKKPGYEPITLKELEGQLPTTDYGDGIDWNKAIKDKIISPKTTLSANNGANSMSLPTHLEVPLYWTTNISNIYNVSNIYVRFPHVEHIQWLNCSNCHPDLFSIKQTGTVEFDKKSNLYGQFCGTCHMTVALPLNGCSRCHPGVKDRHNNPRTGIAPSPR